MNRGALANIRILDLTRVLAGPYCTMMLADMGADVIKIEVPGRGDDTRGMGPFKNGDSLYFANVNRNKKGITLNLKSPEGKKIFLDMVKNADVVVENYRPGVMDKLGLGYDVLKEVNDQIIYAAVSGFGCYGPYSDRPGYDIIAQAMGGLMSITGQAGGAPTRVGNAMGDVLGGMNLTIGVLAAINARHIIGKGQRVDVSLVDSVVASLETGTQRYMVTGKEPELMGNRYAAASPYDSFIAKNGQFVIGCGNQKLFELLCKKVIKREDLLEDPRFDTNDKRCTNHQALKQEIEKWSCNYTIEEAVDAILGAGVPAAPIMGLKDITENEHIAHVREMFVDCEHPVIGKMRVNGNPVKLMETKTEIKSPAPLLGANNEEIYGELLGMDADTLKDLKERGII
ncbi:CaiB/BaiF CoA transferase family protein [Alkaliphilus oremlandii]|uniref:L-carnitine dehydratase/bile acid-inducible protein F n=1 Tax=Alkaliphilus oremlandii (strain OhILAs) TaxID=350688 RepID=A8MEN5_ALKOO|nr:CoA transferase [Alkaliphilus oremlandii]ABW18364.1 L-carnitine dehydratase/bile acid-inducible protein F [Alkaliphilus oremlandii OhILAs]